MSIVSKTIFATQRGSIMIGAIILVMVTAIAFDTTVVKIGSDLDVRKQVFDPDAFGKEQFSRIRNIVLERAPDAPKLAEELAADKKGAIAKYGTPAEGGIGAFLPVRLTGIVGEGRSGVFKVAVEGIPEKTRVRVQTGPAINGTSLRDISGDIEFGAFKNQIEYQDAGSGINRTMSKTILSDLDRDNLTGKVITVVGVFNLINPKNWLITPVLLEVQ